VQLTSYTDYALRVLLYLLSHPEGKATTREMAEAYGISLSHLTKVTKDLTKAGWLVATRGAGGGVRLAPHTPDVKVGEIVRHTENCDLLECFDLPTNTCAIARCCGLRGVLYLARKAFFDVLDAVPLRELVANPAKLRQVFEEQRETPPAAV
jgi:Rrf2 family nitric oxide-sensitive transcriptional repressor